MKIDKEVLKTWKSLRSHGDGKKIVLANTGVRPNDIVDAFKNGECKDTVYEAMAKFYKEKQDKLEKLK